MRGVVVRVAQPGAPPNQDSASGTPSDGDASTASDQAAGAPKVTLPLLRESLGLAPEGGENEAFSLQFNVDKVWDCSLIGLLQK